MDDSDDPIVDEIDIFNCSGIGNKSFILQFPLVSRETQPPAVQWALHDSEKDKYEFVVLPMQDLFAGTDMTYKVTTQKVNISQPLAVGVLRNHQLHLTPVYQVLQARPLPPNQDEESKEYDLNWMQIPDLDEFISASGDDISAHMSSQMYQKMLAGSQEAINIEMIENLDDNELHARPPKEQLIYILVKEKTIRFDEQLQKHGLQAYKEELLSVLLEYAYYIQGRWTIKPEKLPESIFPIDLRIARNFIIVLFSHKQPLLVSLLDNFYSLFNVKKDKMQKVLENLGVRVQGGHQIVFKYKENNQFETLHKKYADKGREEIENLKEAICIAKHDDNLFDNFIE